MTVDAAGDLWVAIYGGGRVKRYAPDGSLREVYPIPAPQCTCCALGGPGRPVAPFRPDPAWWEDFTR
jgi:sugar lactone lactonase YvrE